jgi:ADP-L-glycero-D-manno-heptose 6-epimerase
MSRQGFTVVTGGAGFIGRNMIAELNARGCDDVLVVDHLGTDEKWRNLRGLRFDEVMSPDAFLNATASGGSLPKIDAVIHLGACSATTERDADFLLNNNTHTTRRLCTWSLAQGARFIYASSAATYGDGGQGYDDAPERLEGLRPLNMYGYSKHLFDLWASRHGLLDVIVGLKYFNVFGPFEDHKADMRSLVHKAYGQILERGWIELFKSDRPDYADGEQKRDFIYVRDAVDVTLHFWEHREGGGLFNCGTGQAGTWLELARSLFAAMKLEPDIRFIDMPEILRGKYQYFTQAETRRLRTAGYQKPFTPLNEAVADYVHSHLSG